MEVEGWVDFLSYCHLPKRILKEQTSNVVLWKFQNLWSNCWIHIPQTVNHSSPRLQNDTSWLQPERVKRVASDSRNSEVIHLFDLAKCFKRYKHWLKENAGILPCFTTSLPFSFPQPLSPLTAKSKHFKGNRFTKITILHVSQPVFTALQSLACAAGTYHFGYQREIWSGS